MPSCAVVTPFSPSTVATGVITFEPGLDRALAPEFNGYSYVVRVKVALNTDVQLTGTLNFDLVD